jgi:phosphotransferase system HPr-like phosphotransfer protein
MATPTVLEAEFVLKWRLGARSGMLISSTAQRFQSKVELLQDGLRLDAKKPICVMLIGQVRPKLPDGSWNFGPDAGELVRLAVTGADAVEAMAELTDLFTCGEKVVQCRNTDCISSAILLDYDDQRIIYSCSNCHIWIVDRDSGRVQLRFLTRPKALF